MESNLYLRRRPCLHLSVGLVSRVSLQLRRFTLALYAKVCVPIALVQAARTEVRIVLCPVICRLLRLLSSQKRFVALPHRRKPYLYVTTGIIYRLQLKILLQETEKILSPEEAFRNPYQQNMRHARKPTVKVLNFDPARVPIYMLTAVFKIIAATSSP
jgi:hypothetical protein